MIKCKANFEEKGFEKPSDEKTDFWLRNLAFHKIIFAFPVCSLRSIAFCIHSIKFRVFFRAGLVLFVALLDVPHEFVHSLER